MTSREPDEIVVSIVETATQRAACHAIRREVFCTEQGVDPALEFDGLDDACRHFLACDGGRPVGTARSRTVAPGIVKLERIAVLRADRGHNVGRRLVETALEAAVADGHATATMNAQTYAGPFYEKLGFNRDGAEFQEAGIPHVRMTRPLA